MDGGTDDAEEEEEEGVGAMSPRSARSAASAATALIPYKRKDGSVHATDVLFSLLRSA